MFMNYQYRPGFLKLSIIVIALVQKGLSSPSLLTAMLLLRNKILGVLFLVVTAVRWL